MVTYEHRGMVTWVYTECHKDIFFNDIGFEDMVTYEHRGMVT